MVDMPDAATNRTRLAAALAEQHPVVLHRRSNGDRIDGYVVGIGAKWVLLCHTTEGGYFDGHIAVRLADVRRVRRDVNLTARFAPTRPEWPPTALPGVDLDSTRGLLRSFATHRELVGIETTRRSAMWIGYPDDIIGAHFYLWEIKPDATWHDRPLGYRIRRISTVRMDALYFRALTAVADPPLPEMDTIVWPPVRGR